MGKEQWFHGLASAGLTDSDQARLAQRIVTAIEGHLDRARFNDKRRITPLETWDYWWDALASSDHLVTKVELGAWLQSAGECWMLSDRQRGAAWRVSVSDAHLVRKSDVYLVPVRFSSCCYISPHEEDWLGPWLIELPRR